MSDFKNKNGRLEVQPKAERVGNILPAERNDEVITLGQLSGYGINTAVSYKKYIIYMTQASTAAPIAVELENTLGAITLSRNSAGDYEIKNTASLFGSISKCFIINQQPTYDGASGDIAINCTYANANTISVTSFTINGSKADDLIYGQHFEIRVYN